MASVSACVPAEGRLGLLDVGLADAVGLLGGGAALPLRLLAIVTTALGAPAFSKQAMSACVNSLRESFMVLTTILVGTLTLTMFIMSEQVRAWAVPGTRVVAIPRVRNSDRDSEFCIKTVALVCCRASVPQSARYLNQPSTELVNPL